MIPRLARPESLADSVFRALEERIRSGEFPPGAQLPSEKQLGERLGVSRPVVREAIARLRADGFIETRQGAGAYVAARPGRASFRLLHGEASDTERLRQVFELRLLMEVGAAELAARRRSEADLQALRAALQGMNAALDRQADAVELDDAFHAAVAAASHNPYVHRFVEFLGHQLSDSRRPTWSAEGLAEGRARSAQREHERLFAAIEAGDVAAARAAARAHLRNAARRLGIGELAAGESGVGKHHRAGGKHG